MKLPHIAIWLSVALPLLSGGCVQTRQCPIARQEARMPARAAAAVGSTRDRTSFPASRPELAQTTASIPRTSAPAVASLRREAAVKSVDVDVKPESPIRLTAALGTMLAQQASQTEPLPLPAADEAAPMQASPAASSGMTLAALEQLALANNPAIQQASAAASKAVGIRAQVGRYPNPTIGYVGQQIADAGTDQHAAMIEQDIVLGHKLRLNERVLDHDVQSQLWEVEAQRYRVLTDIRLRFYEALAAQRRVELADDFHRVTEEGVRVAIKRKEALEGSQPEVLQAEIQLNEVDLLRQRAQIAFDAAWKELAATAGVPDLRAAKLVGSLDPNAMARDWDATYQGIVGGSPELRAAYARVHRAQANLERQRAQPIPNLGLQLMGGYDQGTDDEMLGAQVGIPVPIFNKNRGNIDAAYAEYCRATQDARRIELSLKARLARVGQEFDTAAVTVQRYQEQILPKARDTLTLSEQAYGAGEFEFLQVLIARRTYFESNLQYVQALGELAQANATVDGLLLTGGLAETMDFTGDAGLRDQALNGQ
jgi:cobalt-zinc-cadmium efflux system outer membrane protein